MGRTATTIAVGLARWLIVLAAERVMTLTVTYQGGTRFAVSNGRHAADGFTVEAEWELAEEPLASTDPMGLGKEAAWGRKATTLWRHGTGTR